jgi:multidrug efflux pump subunit AcrB
MKRAIAWFAENHVAANLVMLVIVSVGIATLPTIKQEVFPEIELDLVGVSIAYPGASPEEVERSVTVRIEEELEGLQGIKHLRSSSGEGIARVTAELFAGEDARRRVEDIRSAVDRIDTFPDETEEPEVKQVEVSHRVLTVAISGEADEWTLKHLGQQARDEIASLPGISDVSLSSTRPYEISIEVSEAALRQFGLTFDDVVRAVRQTSMDLPGGSIKTEAGEILLRAVGQVYRGRDFGQIPLVSRRDGTRLVVGDVATVVDGFEEGDVRVRFDGEPAVTVQVYRVGEQRTLAASRQVHTWLEKARERMPAGITLTVWNDESDILRSRIDTMLRNARGGFVLVVLILALFLRLRLALWVSLGIPISFLGAIALMPALAMSINFISILAFIIVLGVVVDDAIVVGESTHVEQGRSGRKLEGATLGAQRVVVPVMFGVLTTVVAFAPLLFLPGPMGRVTRVVPIVVICCLLFSLFESMFVLPAHLGHGRKPLDAPPGNAVSALWRRLQDRIATGLRSLIYDVYHPTLDRALEWRGLTLAVAVSLLVVTGGLVAGGYIKFAFLSDVEGDTIVADLAMVQGAPAAATIAAADRIERAAVELRNEIDATRPSSSPSIFTHMVTRVGSQPRKDRRGPFGAATTRIDENLAELEIAVAAPEERDIGMNEITNRWREKVGEIAGVEELTYSSELMDQGAALELQLRGPSLESLRAAAERVKVLFANYPGVFDVRDSFRRGKRELELSIVPSAEALGLTLADLGRQVRQGFYGAEAQSIQRGRDEVKVMVRYPAAERRSLHDVMRMRIRGPDGSEVPFASVAKARLRTGFATIERVDRQRVVTVTADVDRSVSNANEIVRDLLAGSLQSALADHPGIAWSFEGEQAEQREFMRAQAIGFAAALFVIYALLAIPLSSYLQPFVIMSAIPFGIVGAVWGHVILGFTLTMYSVLGLIALSGVVVNASLVLVDYVNRELAGGAPIREAIRNAATARFRPIMLTSLTTFFGLTPLMLETSIQARFMIPMAISLAFGVLFSSFITLLLVPVSYLVLDDLAGLGRRILRLEPTEAYGGGRREELGAK